jgi:hypothetical protein
MKRFRVVKHRLQNGPEDNPVVQAVGACAVNEVFVVGRWIVSTAKAAEHSSFRSFGALVLQQLE